MAQIHDLAVTLETDLNKFSGVSKAKVTVINNNRLAVTINYMPEAAAAVRKAVVDFRNTHKDLTVTVNRVE